MTTDLDETMQFEHVVCVRDGKVSDDIDNRRELWAPECVFDGWGDGAHVEPGTGWELMNGYSGQYRYSGPIMHESEYIGGKLERDILESDGYYVAVVCTDLGASDDSVCGWAVAYRSID